MRFFGGFIAVVGILAIVLPYVGMNFMFLNWINNWGPGVAWGIKIGIVVVGAIMYIAGKPSDEE
jgi:hypothetical protein